MRTKILIHDFCLLNFLFFLGSVVASGVARSELDIEFVLKNQENQLKNFNKKSRYASGGNKISQQKIKPKKLEKK